MTANKIYKEAMKLPEKERNGLARAILHSASEEDDDEIDPELVQELERILKDMDAHPEKCIPFEVVEKELDALMRKDERDRNKTARTRK